MLFIFWQFEKHVVHLTHYLPKEFYKMFDDIINGVKDQIASSITKETDVEPGKLDGIMSVVGDVTKNEVTKEITGGGISGIMNLFSKSENNSVANSIQNNISTGIVSGLMEKVGLGGPIAQKIAGIAVPMVVKLVTDKNSETPDDDPSPITSLFGGGDAGSMLGGLASKFF